MSKLLTRGSAESQQFLTSISEHISARRPRRIVTVRGQGCRGVFPSWKSPTGRKAQYESLLEEDALRTLEVAPGVTELSTQPEVLLISNDGRMYTPDSRIVWRGKPFYLEVKFAADLLRPKVRARLLAVCAGMKERQLPFALLLDTEVRAAGLQEQLKVFLRSRPLVNPRLRSIDPTLWNPAQPNDPANADPEWLDVQARAEQAICSSINRDPLDYISSLSVETTQ